MKTVSRNPSSLFGAVIAVGALAGLYFFRRNGGQVTPLVKKGVDYARNLQARATESAPEAVGAIKEAASNAREVLRSPEEMDRFQAP